MSIPPPNGDRPPSHPAASAPGASPGPASPAAAPNQPAWPPYASPPRPPAPRGTRVLIGLAIGGGGLVLLAVIAGILIVALAAAQGVRDTLANGAAGAGGGFGGAGTAANPTYPDPPMSGDPGDAEAVTPLDCGGPCFDDSDIVATAADPSARVRLGLTEQVLGEQTYPASSAYALSWRDWSTYHGAPDPCFFTIAKAPLVDEGGAGGTPARGEVAHLSDWSDLEVSTLTQAGRIFPDTASATAYLAALRDQIDGCAFYKLDAWGADVTAAVAIEVPDDVSAVGWVESADPYRYYVMDVQRANLVVRVTLSTDGSIGEQEFRDLMAGVVDRMEALTPAS